MLDEAIELGRLGFRVFPLHHKDKNPAITGWTESAASDEAKIRELWAIASQAYQGPFNIGILMGRNAGRLGLDIDLDDGANPEFLYNLPLSVTTKTSKGYHVFYDYPAHWPEIGKLVLQYGLRDGKNKACVTIRGNNHYFVAPPSIHPETGLAYEFQKYTGWDEAYKGPKCDLLSPDEVPLAMAPDWLLAAIEAQESRRPGDKYEENTRHGMFVTTATAMRKDGKSEDEILARLIERNLQDCVPPKENCERELRNITKWCMVSVQPTPLEEKIRQREEKRKELMPLGYDHTDYFYLSRSNRQIVKLGAGSHSPNGLLHIMPEEYWRTMYPGKKGAINWQRAASDMMEACRKRGVFSVERVRGAGAWLDDNRLVLHLGSSLLVDGVEHDLFELPTRNIYELSSNYPGPPAEESTPAENQLFLDACESASWKHCGSAKLFAGALALLRIGGALPWRPHLWLTGPAGSGKTTLFTTLVKQMAGDHAAYFQGTTTEAGIRQELLSDSRPVIFDEAETTNDKRSGGRMKHILELARQASSESDARIVKGTPDGKGLRFKINSQFVLASIRVNLAEEADQTRFAVVELVRPKGDEPGPFLRKIEAVTQRIADGIYARAVKRFKTLLENFDILKMRIAIKSSHRHGQQYGMLLAGYALLKYEGAITEKQADDLISEVGVLEQRTGEVEADEHHCLAFLLEIKIRAKLSATDHSEDIPVSRLIQIAQHNSDLNVKLQEYGLSVNGKCLYVSTCHSYLAQSFRDQKWQDWGQALSRLPGAERDRAYFLKRRARAVQIPLSLLTSTESAPDSSVSEPF